MSKAYFPHAYLTETARRRPELWRLLVGLLLIGVLVSLLNMVFFAALVAMGPNEWAQELLAGSSPLALILLLVSFGFITFGVAVAARKMQHRTLWSILGERRLAVTQFVSVLKALLILGVIGFLLPPYGMGGELTQKLPLTTWVLLLPVAAFAVLIQVSAEEILFRGYIQQTLAARFNSPIIWMGVPSILFAVGHYAPDAAGGNALLIALWAFVFGLLASDLTARAGTLGPAIALHFFNNVIALLFISLPDSLSGLALFVLPFDTSDAEQLRPWLLVDLVMMFVCWLAARLALRR
ncbi:MULTISPECIES: CPBP family intramembrane glutamic endopeptidase [unclassified Ruegeria]|uniref:CPBP family intramembrane glutamic endopeptidase n=1 Tax=unclassified Ruegeria TaxID=2625375 RepID=UPI0014894BCD|nr:MULTISPECIES: CPBP family intramembrane glutamic endopeptidase [unclassified Ruegeria]NOD64515.1 CPBP family intramembrane metalloprotease [Ruegeria sp. HKCCD6109]